MIRETIAKIRAEHFIAAIAAIFIASSARIFLLNPLQPMFMDVPLSFTIAGFIVNVGALYALSRYHFHFSRQDAEGIAAAYGLLALWQASNSMVLFLSGLMAYAPEEYGIFMKLAAIASSAVAALVYAGVIFVIFWYAFPVKNAKR